MWIHPIYDRTYSDILFKNRKAYINTRDLNRIEGNMKYAIYALSSLDMTYLNADVTFQKAQDGDSIRYASADGWRGIMITAIKEGLKVENAETGQGVFYTLEQLGLSKMTEKFNLKLGVDMGTFSMGTNSKGK